MKNIFYFISALVLLSSCAPSGKTFEPRVDDLASTAPDALNQSNQDEAPTPPVTNTSAAARAPALASQAKSVGVSQFNQPWKNSAASIVIDVYQGNSIDWNRMATDKRVVGVIHRSSIGLTVDSQYKARKKIAKDRGYLWGAYHLGRSGDPIAQAKFFLKTIENDPETLMALDLENTSSQSMMNIANSVQFMNYVYNTTGRVPVVYANDTVTKALNQALATNTLFHTSRLWYARFRSSFSDFPKGIWSTYFLWQFSSEINCGKNGSCLYNVPGTSRDMDINVFAGSKQDLSLQWK
jgi:lysozyme